MQSSWMLGRVTLVRTDVSEESSASIIRVLRKNASRIHSTSSQHASVAS
jgi:hypothetical protein